MAKTHVDAVTHILEKLHVLESGETPQAADSALVLRVLVPRLEYLRDDELAYWPDDAIPDAVFDPFCEYMLYFVGPVFRPSGADDQRFAARSQRGMTEMRRHLAKRSEGAPVKADYF